MRTALLSFRKPIVGATLNFGGMRSARGPYARRIARSSAGSDLKAGSTSTPSIALESGG